MRDIVKQHKETFDEDNLRDFVDVYLKEMRSSPDISFTEEELLVVSMDMFTAGSETTSTTLAWAVNYMITHPEIQARVQAEIDAVLGDRPPSLEDKEALNFTVATIMEIQVWSENSAPLLELLNVCYVQRVAAIAPMAVPHRAMSDIDIRGYKIPKVNTFDLQY